MVEAIAEITEEIDYQRYAEMMSTFVDVPEDERARAAKLVLSGTYLV